MLLYNFRNLPVIASLILWFRVAGLIPDNCKHFDVSYRTISKSFWEDEVCPFISQKREQDSGNEERNLQKCYY
jgi:hypothetical protein